jgi:hypothetical protein
MIRRRRQRDDTSARERKPPRWVRPLRIPPVPERWSTGPPDFVGVGAQRSGTSWWYRGLEEHPRIAAVPDRDKELHYFNRFWNGELPADFGATYHRMFPRPSGALCGEWTPRYMLDYWTPTLLREAAPQAKLLVLLRDPVERFRSGVERAVRRAPGGRPIDLGTVSDAVARGLYAAQLRRVLDHFPREQVLVQQFERCRDEPLGQLNVTLAFLGLEPLEALPASMARERTAARKPELPARWRAELAARLEPDVRELASLFPQLDLGLWPSFRGLG